jgi:hypothetical protein
MITVGSVFLVFVNQCPSILLQQNLLPQVLQVMVLVQQMCCPPCIYPPPTLSGNIEDDGSSDSDDGDNSGGGDDCGDDNGNDGGSDDGGSDGDGDCDQSKIYRSTSLLCKCRYFKTLKNHRRFTKRLFFKVY